MAKLRRPERACARRAWAASAGAGDAPASRRAALLAQALLAQAQTITNTQTGSWVLSLGASSVGVPLVAWLHGSAGGFNALFLVLAGCAGAIALAAMTLLPSVRSAALALEQWLAGVA